MVKKRLSGFLALAIFAFAVLSPMGVLLPQGVQAAVPVTGVAGYAFADTVASSVYMKLDGNLDESVWNPMDAVLNNTVTGGTSNNSVTFGSVWDATYLYIGIRVLDSQVVNYNHDLQLYEDDSVEIFLDGDNAKGSAYDTNDYQIFIRTDNRVIVKQKSQDIVLPGLQTAVSPIAEGYTVEVQVPWQSLGTAAKDGTRIGLDVANNDNDGADASSVRYASLTWNAKGNTNWGNPGTFGTLYLVDQNRPVISTEGSPAIDGNPGEAVWHLDHFMTAGNNTVAFGSLADSDYLYLGFMIQDAAAFRDSGADIVNDDSLEIFIDGDNSKSSPYDSQDRHLRIGYGDSAAVEVGSRSLTGVMAKSTAVAGGWAVEVAVPWITLGAATRDRMMVGLDLTVNDDDDGGLRESAAAWNNSGTGNAADTSRFGHIIIDNANIVKPTYTGPKETYTDPASDLTKVFAKSAGIALNSTAKVGTWGEGVPRIMNGWTIADRNSVIYKSPSLEMLSFEVETLEQSGSNLEIYVSPDNVAYTKLNRTIQYQVSTVTAGASTNGWYGKIRYAAANLPAGTMYLKLEFIVNGGNAAAVLLENMSFDYKVLPAPPVYTGPRVSFVDPAADMTLLYKKESSNMINQSADPGTFGKRNRLYNNWRANAYMIYKSPEGAGDILTFNIEALEKGGRYLEFYVSADDAAYTKLLPDVHFKITAEIAASADTKSYAKIRYESIYIPEGMGFLKIGFLTDTTNGTSSLINSAAMELKKTNLPPATLPAIQKHIVQDTSVTGYVYGRDGDQDTLSYSIATAPKNGTAAVANVYEDSWTYTPNPGYIGSDIFEVQASDGQAASRTKVVVITTYAPSHLTYYVDAVNGDNAYTGLSEAQAFQTIQKAADLTKPGDTVLIMNGTYTEDDSRGDKEGVVIVSRSGLPGAYITYKAYPGHKPKLQVQSHWNHFLVTASYIKVEGLEIAGNAQNIPVSQSETAYQKLTNPPFSWSDPDIIATSANGISIRPRSSSAAYMDKVPPTHVEIRNNYVHDVPGGGIMSDQADYLTIEGNVVHDSAIRSAFANSGISVFHAQNSDHYNDPSEYQYVIRNNVAYRNQTNVMWYIQKAWSDGNGIIVDDFINSQIKAHYPNNIAIPYTGRTLVENNVVYENGGSGIHSFQSNDVDLFNNTAYGNNVTPQLKHWGQMFVQNGTDNRMMNNILVASDPLGNVTSNMGNKTGVVYDYNVYYGGAASGIPKKGANDIIADPLFADLANRDFRLTAGSPAIDSGNGAVAPATDLAGIPRPYGLGVDRGAYEFVEGLTPETAYFDRYAPAEVAFQITGAVQSIAYGGTVLTEGEQYTVSGSTYALSADYLLGLADGSHSFTFLFSTGLEKSVSVAIIDTDPAYAVPPVLTRTGVTADSIALSWSEAQARFPMAGYELYRDGVRLAAVSGTERTYQDSGLRPGTVYSYLVKAIPVHGGAAITSEALAVRTLAEPYGASFGAAAPATPAAPVSVTEKGVVIAAPKPVLDNGVYITSIKPEDLKKAAESKQPDTGARLIIQVDAPREGRAVSVGLPGELFRKESRKDWQAIEVATSAVSLELLSHALPVEPAAGKRVELTIAPEDGARLPEEARRAVGNNPAYRFALAVDGASVSRLDGGQSVAVRMNYALGSGRQPGKAVAYRIGGDGTVSVVKNSWYDEQTGQLAFRTDRFDLYAIAYRDMGFADTADIPWANSQIEALAVRDIVAGVGAERFAPHAVLTREQWLAILMNMFELQREGASTTLKDVAPEAWYYQTVAAAESLGIAEGYEDGTFGAGKPVSREEMAVMASRIMQHAGIAVSPAKDGVAFADQSSISGYALDAVNTLRSMGLLQGTGDNRFAPGATATRAQAAVLAYNLLRSGS